MISRYTYKDLVWIDVQSPTQDEVRGLMEEFNVHPLAADPLAPMNGLEHLAITVPNFPIIVHYLYAEAAL